VYDAVAQQCTQPLSGVTGVSAGWDHTCALTAEGGVKCWGLNVDGALGNGTTVDSATPVDVVGLSGEAVALAAGLGHTCALIETGSVQCWGSNVIGQLGDGQSCGADYCATPVDVTGLADAVAVTADTLHTCALTQTGEVKCWGVNDDGELGDGSHSNIRTTPVDVIGLKAGAAAVGTGWTHTCAVTTGGGAMCWGSHWYGQIGDGGICNFGQGRIICPLPVPVVERERKRTPGNANCDAEVSSVDAALILQFQAAVIPALPCPSLADVTDDGEVNALDAALILQYEAGLIPAL
jgi:alpha-tubulin suppressor-like RCC1 family protein